MSEEFDLFGAEGDNKEYEEMMAQKKAEADAAKAKDKKAKPVLKSAVVLEVKPSEAETDLEALVEWMKKIEMPGLEWKSHELVPVAYGIKKICILTHVEDEVTSVDDLVEKIEENEDVQSVEIGSFTKL